MADGRETAHPAWLLTGIRDVPAADWNRLANPSGDAFNPFVSHEFLAALEDSASVGRDAGWRPRHLILRDNSRIAAAPLYEKANSFGEYVFDHHWADAFQRAGGRYFPKLLCASPFTPATGPRLLTGGDASMQSRLAEALIAATTRLSTSSAHVNFLTQSDAEALARAGFLTRHGVQYHWFNRGYADFDAFLNALSSRKRKAIRRERRESVSDGVRITRLIGRDIAERHWDAFWAFYQDTGARKWGRPYLTREFFRLISETMRDHLLLIIAEREGRPIAGALNFIGGDALYGRYWGALEARPFLHFEVCYHQAIEFAIERGLTRIEAGAQGDHKIARGYEPVRTYSAHWIADPSFRRAVAKYLDRERAEIDAAIEALTLETPFRKDDAP